MKEFIMAALPFIILGLCIIIIIKFNMDDKNKDNTYILEGMGLGMSFGLMIGSALKYDIGLCLSLGMIIGEVIGYSLTKDNKKK